jgi:hypothetical protein
MTIFSENVGTVTIGEDQHDTQNYEVAAWHTDYELTPGEYVVRASQTNHTHRPGLVTFWATVPGTVVDSYTPSLLGGVPVSGQPQGKNHRDVGRVFDRHIRVNHADVRGLSNDKLVLQPFVTTGVDRDTGRMDMKLNSWGISWREAVTPDHYSSTWACELACADEIGALCADQFTAAYMVNHWLDMGYSQYDIEGWRFAHGTLDRKYVWNAHLTDAAEAVRRNSNNRNTTNA